MYEVTENVESAVVSLSVQGQSDVSLQFPIELVDDSATCEYILSAQSFLLCFW